METTEKPAETVEKPVEDAGKTKFCKHCGAKIPPGAVICTACGRQVEELKKAAEAPQMVITNANTNVNTNNNTMGMPSTRKCNKWVAFCLCLFLGVVGGHKFYEGKIGMGILYLCTGGLCGIGALIDLIKILMKPNPYFVAI